MIPADHFHDNANGTAWWVWVGVPVDDSATALDRPCDSLHCHEGYIHHGHYSEPCPDCSGTGRHTFTVEVECFDNGEYLECPTGSKCSPACDGRAALRVSVVPGMVLPIQVIPSPLEPDEMLRKLETTPQPFIGLAQVSGMTVLVEHDQATPITLPSAAAPGMWAVTLTVAS